tara:strand:- start:177 stop:563 length:387 start_codon:yes stop_codon:yes gene_type:complete
MVLPKPMRIKGHKNFDYIIKAGRRYHSHSLLLRSVKSKWIKNPSNTRQVNESQFRCAVSISNKVSKKAVERNRLKRIFHNYLKIRFFQNQNYSGNSILLTLKPNSLTQSTTILLKELDHLLSQAGFIQ